VLHTKLQTLKQSRSVGQLAVSGAKISAYNIAMVALAIIMTFIFMYLYYELKDEDFDDDS
jgi:hypothetical protein